MTPRPATWFLASAQATRVYESGPPLAGDHAMSWTFAAVYKAHFAFVWRIVRRLGVDDSAVDDVVQDVFLVVHRQLSWFRGESSKRSWLFAIASRLVRDSRRSLRRKPGNLGGGGRVCDDVGLSAGAGSSPHETTAAGEETRARVSAKRTPGTARMARTRRCPERARWQTFASDGRVPSTATRRPFSVPPRAHGRQELQAQAPIATPVLCLRNTP